ncbi:serine acetyltransferase [Bacillus mycoides]|uniref:serine O-acetyltransferase n=1 Tax=Bacillus mycoides TaxID=1405 RepID=UPI00103BF9E4|nr:serine acetyltransferase [Bacillus mycoides]TBX82491.1 serine acetyltransferase [Bacillus mycoides]
MNQKIINGLEQIISMIFSFFIKIRSIPLLGVLSYFFFKSIGVEIPSAVKIGKNVKLVHWANGLVIHPNTTIGDNVKLYQGVTLGRTDIHKPIEQSKMQGIVIEKGAIICAGAKVLCKDDFLTVGKNTVVGANSVLTCSTGDNEIWAGVPAKKIGNIK